MANLGAGVENPFGSGSNGVSPSLMIKLYNKLLSGWRCQTKVKRKGEGFPSLLAMHRTLSVFVLEGSLQNEMTLLL